MIGTYIGYTNFIVFLFLLTGAFALRYDVSIYKKAGMMKEWKGARMAGYTNLVLGVLVFVGYYIYKKWFW